MKVRILKQKHCSGCGPTSIKMIVNYFGIKMSQKNIEILCGNWKKEGMNNKDIVATLKKIGLNVKASYNSGWQDLVAQNSNDKVIIVSWMLRGYVGHFSVVEKMDKKHIWLNDPESGRVIKLEKTIFMRLWFDYDDLWYPKKSSDFKLRWMAVVFQKK
ncbi:MAG: C39 family peptidase [Candidatus Zambryskibacteria bacterium]|nr:C39 family peptidase [Candidatus Zambryskibacteria bacterium]